MKVCGQTLRKPRSGLKAPGNVLTPSPVSILTSPLTCNSSDLVATSHVISDVPALVRRKGIQSKMVGTCFHGKDN